MRPAGGWKTIAAVAVAVAVAEYVDWYNHRPLHRALGLVPPAEYENNYWQSTTQPCADNPSLTEAGTR